MARKSAAQRISELTELIAEYDNNLSAKKANDWDYRFCIAMLEKLNRKKALTKKMRAKIDLIVEVGLKEPPSSPVADEMERLSGFLINPSTKSALSDFAHKVRMGWNLSVKQKAFADKLIAEAKEIEANGHWEPSEEVREKMVLVCELMHCYNSMYWSTHAVGFSALRMLNAYIDGSIPHISEKIWESAKHAVRGKLRQIEEPRFEIGSKCFARVSSWDEDGKRMNTKHFGIICSPPVIYNKDIGYDVLVNGICTTMSCSSLSKR